MKEVKVFKEGKEVKGKLYCNDSKCGYKKDCECETLEDFNSGSDFNFITCGEDCGCEEGECLVKNFEDEVNEELKNTENYFDIYFDDEFSVDKNNLYLTEDDVSDIKRLFKKDSHLLERYKRNTNVSKCHCNKDKVLPKLLVLGVLGATTIVALKYGKHKGKSYIKGKVNTHIQTLKDEKLKPEYEKYKGKVNDTVNTLKEDVKPKVEDKVNEKLTSLKEDVQPKVEEIVYPKLVDVVDKAMPVLKDGAEKVKDLTNTLMSDSLGVEKEDLSDYNFKKIFNEDSNKLKGINLGFIKLDGVKINLMSYLAELSSEKIQGLDIKSAKNDGVSEYKDKLTLLIDLPKLTSKYSGIAKEKLESEKEDYLKLDEEAKERYINDFKNYLDKLTDDLIAELLRNAEVKSKEDKVEDKGNTEVTVNKEVKGKEDDKVKEDENFDTEVKSDKDNKEELLSDDLEELKKTLEQNNSEIKED